MSPWKDRLLGAPQQRPNPYESDPVRLVPEPTTTTADRKTAEAKWAHDAEVLERYGHESPLYARTVLDLDRDPLLGYEREIEPFVMERWRELNGPSFRAEVKA